MSISTDQVKKNIETIVLAHMEVDVDIDSLLLDDYPYAERDLAIYLVKGYYSRYLEKLQEGGSIHPELKKRALDHSKWYVIRRLTTEFHDLIDRTTTLMLDDAKQTGWFRSDYFGYDSIAELLSSVADEQEVHSSSWWDWTFIADTLLPYARSIDIDPSDLMCASVQIRKFRAIVPTTREILGAWKNNRITPKEAKETITWLVKQVADPRVSARSLEATIIQMRGKQVNRPDPIRSSKYILPDSRTWIVIPCKTPEEERAVEMALRNVADVHLSHLDELLSSITALITKITNEELTALYEPVQSVSSS